MSTPLISADNTWALMAITCGWAAFSIYAEQTWKWASKVSGAIVALIGALVLTNLGIIPTNCVWFDDIVWGYVVPMAIPMLLLSCDIRKIGREAGKILVIFMIGAIGTSVGAIPVSYTHLDVYKRQGHYCIKRMSGRGGTQKYSECIL